jgi:AbrB family looped-hinge helix DNA binding protein
MRAAIDRVGRVVVPKPIREALALRGGEVLEIDVRDGVIEMRPVAADVEIVDTPEGPVARQRTDAPALTDELVRNTLEQVRR